MPVWPPQNTGIFNLKFPCGAPPFTVTPDYPYQIVNSAPAGASWTSPVITVTPTFNVGTVSLVIAEFLGMNQSSATVWTVTQLTQYTFTVTCSDTSGFLIASGVFFAQYQDSAGNLAEVMVAVGGFIGGASSTLVLVGTSLSPLTASGSGVPTSTNTATPGFAGSYTWAWTVYQTYWSIGYPVVDPMNIGLVAKCLPYIYPPNGSPSTSILFTLTEMYFYSSVQWPYESNIYGLVAGSTSHTVGSVTTIHYTPLVPITFNMTGRNFCH